MPKLGTKVIPVRRGVVGPVIGEATIYVTSTSVIAEINFDLEKWHENFPDEMPRDMSVWVGGKSE